MIKTEPVLSTPINPEKVFAALEEDRKNGILANTVSNAAVQYQASGKYPGYLEKIDADGNITTGQFEGGQFITKTSH